MTKIVTLPHPAAERRTQGIVVDVRSDGLVVG
jgi:hypothetical protein